MKKVISFSVWGTDPDYLVGAVKNAEIASEVYPGWETWFYVEEGTNVNLEDKASKVIYYSSEPGTDGAFQRFRPMEDDSVDVFISRDTDSRLSDREYQAVQVWLNSDKQFHCMRDHQAHVWPVMAGMWGAKREGLINLKYVCNVMRQYKKGNYFDDQKALAYYYNMFAPLFMEHDDALRFKGSPFPSHKAIQLGSFVGQRITQYDKEGRV
jgi:hypothetical protein